MSSERLSPPMIDVDEAREVGVMRERLASLPAFDSASLHDAGFRSSLRDRLAVADGFWHTLIERVRQVLERHAYVVVRGLPFDEGDALSVALASELAIPVRHNRRVPDLVRRITPRPGPESFEDRPHTDSAHWPVPNDLTTLQCVRTDKQGGGRSRIVPVEDVLDELERAGDGRTIAELERREMPFLLDRDFGKGGWQRQRVLTVDPATGRRTVRFCAIDSRQAAERFTSGLSDEDDALLGRFEEAAFVAGRRREFALRSGDWLLFDNRRTLHGKTFTAEKTRRLLKKMKLVRAG